jgi:hypothetical protein
MFAGVVTAIIAVSPGPTDTPMSLRPGETEADRAARLKTALPIGRVGALEEIASGRPVARVAGRPASRSATISWSMAAPRPEPLPSR